MINPFKSKYEGSLDSSSVPQYALGAPTSPQTANQIAEATARLNAGVFGVDLALIDEKLFEQIPKQHFKEIERLMTLTGAKATIHGPIIDLAGFSQQGWQEESRRENESKMKYYMDMAHEVDSKGNTPLNFHINTAMIGEQKRKLSNDEYKSLSEEERETVKEIFNPLTHRKEYEVVEVVGAVDRETGQIAPLKREIKQYPGRVKVWEPYERLDNLNQTQWDQERLKIFQLQQQKAEIMDRIVNLERQAHPLRVGEEKGVLSTDETRMLQNIDKNKNLWISHINELNQHIYTGLNEVYNNLQYYTEKEDKEKAIKLRKSIDKGYKDYDKRFSELVDKSHKQKLTEAEGYEASNMGDLQYRELQLSLDKVGNPQHKKDKDYLPAPQKYIPTNQLALEKTAETVANVVFDSYNKYKNNSPILLLENLSPEGTLGSAQDLVNSVEESRKKLIRKLMKEKGLDEYKAKDVAEKLIGVTWDVGHINFMRKHGYSEADVLRETEKISPYVKQVHITDNFGFNDAHLPPGMGNAPIKEEMELIAKEMRKKGLDFKKGSVIVEAGSFVGQFKENPHPYALEYFESPLYTYKNMPVWKDVWETEGSYGLGYGQILPEQHFGMYGAGFSNLPTDLGGPISQDRSRFAGTPNA